MDGLVVEFMEAGVRKSEVVRALGAAPQEYSWYFRMRYVGSAPTAATLKWVRENATHSFFPENDFSLVMENAAAGIGPINLRKVDNRWFTISTTVYATLYVDNAVNIQSIENLDPLVGAYGDNLRLRVTVRNTGRYTDNYYVSAVVGGTIDPVWTGPVNPDSSATVTLTVTLPFGTENIVITAAGDFARDQDYVTATGLLVRRVDVSILPSLRQGRGGENLVYTVVVKNTGNAPDNFILNLSEALGWPHGLIGAPGIVSRSENMLPTDDVEIWENMTYPYTHTRYNMYVGVHWTTDDNRMRSYIKFNLSGLPAGATITGATLQLNAQHGPSHDPDYAPDNDTVIVHAVDNDNWTEQSLVGAGKGGLDNAPAMGAEITRFAFINKVWIGENHWYTVDVTSYVASEFARGDPVVSLGLVSDNENNFGDGIAKRGWFYTKDATGAGAAYKPALLVEYEVPQTGELDPGENWTGQIWVVVSGPPCTTDNLTLKVTSTGDNTVSKSATCQAHSIGFYVELYDEDNNFVSGYDNIQPAIDNALPGYRVIVYPRTYKENLLVHVENLTIRSTGGAGMTIIDASGGQSGIKIVANRVTFIGFTVKNGDYGIWLSSANNCMISNNYIDNNGHGIYITGGTSSAAILFNNIINNVMVDSGIHITPGVDSTKLLVNYNNIVGNSTMVGNYGAYNSGNGKLNARYNWWGRASGPGGAGPGAGDNVSENVDYRPWLPEPFENLVVGWGTENISKGLNKIEIENVEVSLDSKENGWIMITVLENLDGAPYPENLLRAGMFIDISTFPENIAENIWITVHYTDEDVIGIDEENLKLYYWRDENWRLCDNITVIVENNIIRGFISHLTPFGIFGPPAPAPGVEVSISPSKASASPGWTLSYEVKVTNTGGIRDNYKLEVRDTKNWPLKLGDNLFENVLPGKSRTTTLWVTIPDNATHCTEDNITITATSQENAMVSAENSCIAHVIIEKPTVPNPENPWEPRENTRWGTKLVLENSIYVSEVWFGAGTTSSAVEAPPDPLDGVIVEFFENGSKYSEIVRLLGAAPQRYNWQCRMRYVGDAPTAATLSSVLENATHSFVPQDHSVVLDNLSAGILVNLRRENKWFNLSSPVYATLYVDNALNIRIENTTPTTAAGGRKIIFDVTVFNTGRYDDNYELSASDNLGWGLVLSPSTLSVRAGQSKTATLTATVTRGGMNRIMVTAKGAYAFDYSMTTAFGLPIWVLISPSENHGLPGATLIYTFTVKNIGEKADNYALRISDTENWPNLALDDNLIRNVAPGENRTTTLRVTIPGNAVGGTRDNITVTATSLENVKVSDSVTCTAFVDYLGVQVSISPSSQSGAPGEKLDYIVTVKNTGNLDDNYTLEVSDRWSAQISPASLAVPAGASRTATLSVTIPSDANKGDSMVITVTATSQIDNAVSGSARCTAIAEVPEVLPYVPPEEKPPPSPRLPAEERGPLMLMGIAIFVAFLAMAIAWYVKR
jgi:parallel beta-helix repeat protein